MREFHVLNLGAGVQSTALFLLGGKANCKLPFDPATFADTGKGQRVVYDHLDCPRSLGDTITGSGRRTGWATTSPGAAWPAQKSGPVAWTFPL